MASEAAPPFFAESIVFLAATVVAVPIAKRLGLGSVVGYLAAGAAIGPHGLQLLGSGEDVLHVAELGVVLLLFVIGLELDPQKLWRMKRDIFGLGSAQVMLTGLTLLGVGLISGSRSPLPLSQDLDWRCLQQPLLCKSCRSVDNYHQAMANELSASCSCRTLRSSLFWQWWPYWRRARGHRRQPRYSGRSFSFWLPWPRLFSQAGI